MNHVVGVVRIVKGRTQALLKLIAISEEESSDFITINSARTIFIACIFIAIQKNFYEDAKTIHKHD